MAGSVSAIGSGPVPCGSANLSASHRFATSPVGPFEIRADVINLFDEVYRIRNGTGVGVFAPQYGPRRGFFAGFTKEF